MRKEKLNLEIAEKIVIKITTIVGMRIKVETNAGGHQAQMPTRRYPGIRAKRTGDL